ncbi:hypothetical protein LS71_006625 [Helicobacter jaachi]|uniref:Flagellin N-terminal domain-containing protein n=1 Tax=Helicobacter jaachi TaxID=1677920 RepID=A0A4U8TAI1_9HELI|nr:hypothetical protein [Helicobacter jaachi]TLD96148.1 hypothetical protein LS71_006625 [Helicobacter jaachi]
MKISTSTTQNLAQEEIKREAKKDINKKDLKETKQAQNAPKSAQKVAAKSVDTSELKNSPLTQEIKNINSNIGRLQVAQKSLDAIESDVRKVVELTEQSKQTADKKEQNEIQDEINALKKNIESTLKKATFESSNVFAKSIMDNDEVLFDAPKLNVSLLNSNAQKFYDVLKEQQVQVKDALETLKDQAEENADKLAKNDKALARNKAGKIQNENKAASRDMQNTDGSFLKKLGSLFRVSHDTDKLSNQRVKELLA